MNIPAVELATSKESTRYDEYAIESAPLANRYARGWHVVGAADDFSNNPKAIDCFGTRLVLWRGEEDKKVHAINAYCPHMGADLSKGCVRGDDVVCPFHSWVWDAEGHCVDIPYANKIPDKAKIRGWDTLERNGLIYIWHDHEKNPPIPAQTPAKIDDWYAGNWTDWHMQTFRIESNCRELVDNMADFGHFGPVHYSKVNKFRNVRDGHKYIQYLEGGHAILTAGQTPLTSVATYEGPAYMTTVMTGEMNGEPTKVHLLISHTPVNFESFDIRFGVMMENDPKVSSDENEARIAQNVQMNVDSFIQDVEIWNNKLRVDNPVLCDGDGPIHLLRNWYSQFYRDVDDIPERLTAYKKHVTADGGEAV